MPNLQNETMPFSTIEKQKIENTDYNFLNIVFLCYNLVPMNAKPVSGETETLLYGRKKYEL